MTEAAPPCPAFLRQAGHLAVAKARCHAAARLPAAVPVDEAQAAEFSGLLAACLRRAVDAGLDVAINVGGCRGCCCRCSVASWLAGCTCRRHRRRRMLLAPRSHPARSALDPSLLASAQAGAPGRRAPAERVAQHAGV